MEKAALPLSAIICVMSVILAVIILLNTNKSVEPRFTPPPFDDNAVAGTPDIDSEIGYGEIDAKAYRVGVCGKIKPEGNKAFIYLNNLSDNKVWIKARIFDIEGEIIGESGLIRQGEYLPFVTLSNIPDDKKLSIKIMAYEPDTYYSAGAVTLDAVIKGD